MPLPTKSEIIAAVENPDNIVDSQLNGFSYYPGLLDEPIFYPGGFGLVFPMHKGGEKVAFRVWHLEIPYIKKRMLEISFFLKKTSIPFFVNFELITSGLKVPTDEGLQMIDTVRMDWVEGFTLKKHINNLIKSEEFPESEKKNRLQKLAISLLNVFRTMHKYHVSHGDLQHGNIIVTNNGDVKLIDYDSLYVPNMHECSHVTLGLSGYQHPKRIDSKYANEKTDCFSELIIFMGVYSLSKDLTLWERYKLNSRDYSFIFDSDDFKDIHHCKLYNELVALDPVLSKLALILDQYLINDNIDDLDFFDKIIYNMDVSLSPSASFFCVCCGNKYIDSFDKYCFECGVKRRLI